MSVVSGSQFRFPGPAQGMNLYPNKTLADDEHTLGEGSMGGWKFGGSPEPLGAQNLSSAQKPFAWRAPDSAGLGKNTIGTWQGNEGPWHERYRSD